MTYKGKENLCFQLSQVTKNNSYACVDMFVSYSIRIGCTLERITDTSLLMAIYHFI